MSANHYPWHQTTLNHTIMQLRERRQPHATLFRQRPDYDDTALGWHVVKRLLCDDYSGADKCKHCRLLNDLSHPNVLFLDVVNEKIGIDHIRELEQQIWQTSMFNKPKVAYIQGMDLLSLGAQNALLKTLEEPPQNAFFVLSVQNLSQVLPTIMSRVQRLRHGKFEESQLLHWLRQQSPSSVSEAEIAKTAKLADFAPLRAHELLTQADAVKQLEQEKAQFAQFMSGKCSASKLAETLEKAQVSAQLSRYRRYTEGMIRFLFDKSATANQPTDNKRADNNGGNSVQYATWNGVSLRALYALHDILTTLQRLAETNVNLQLQFTTSLTEWQNERK